MTRQELEDERTFLLRSLEDLDREHEAGDLTDDDHARLRDEYIARTAAVLKSLEGGAPPPDPKRSGREAPRPHRQTIGTRKRRMLTWAGVAVVTGAGVWALVSAVSGRLPGQTSTGSITLSSAQQETETLAQAQTAESSGDAVTAVKLYQSVLDRDPKQEEALAELGWLEYEAGVAGKNGDLLSLGQRRERQAELVRPGAFAPHLYLGSMLLAEGQPTEAVAEYRTFLADHPPKETLRSAVPFLTKAFAQAHEPMPALQVGPAPKG